MGFAKELRKGKINASSSKEGMELILVLDNVYDTFNIGGMYRIGDAAGVTEIMHGENTPPGPDPKISRSSVGLDKYIPHSYQPNLKVYLQEKKAEGYFLISLEQTETSKLYDEVNYRLAAKDKKGIILLSGNETFGVQEELTALADLVVELPMYGINKSLNVVVATGIVLYEIGRSVRK